MTKTEITCGPNNFAMLGRIARYELNASEYYLYGTIIDMAVNNRLTKSNKKMSKAIKASVNTYKTYRDALWHKGYIRLYYRNEDEQLILLKRGERAETFSSITIEVVDIWQANLYFQETKPDSADAIPNLEFLQVFSSLKQYFPSPCQPIKGVVELMGGYQPVDRGVSISEQGDISQLIAGGQPVDSNSNKYIKTILKDLDKKKKRKDYLRHARILFFTCLIESLLQADIEIQVEEETPIPDPDFSDTVYTQAEYEYFIPQGISADHLSTHVLDPCLTDAEGISPGTWIPRDYYRVSDKKLSDWQKMIAVVQNYFPVGEGVGYATKIAQQLYGTAKNGQRKFCMIDPPMTPIEACAFAYWLKVAKDLDQLPERAERIEERVMQFRALPNHFVHVNHARYVLDNLLADPIEIEEQDPDLFKPADPEYRDQIIDEVSELLGFPLIGDFG